MAERVRPQSNAYQIGTDWFGNSVSVSLIPLGSEFIRGRF